MIQCRGGKCYETEKSYKEKILDMYEDDIERELMKGQLE